MIFKKWRERKAEDFRVWIAEYLFKTHIQPTLNHVNAVTDFAATDCTNAGFNALEARSVAIEANKRSAELGKMISRLQKQMGALQSATRYLAQMADKRVAEGH